MVMVVSFDMFGIKTEGFLRQKKNIIRNVMVLNLRMRNTVRRGYIDQTGSIGQNIPLSEKLESTIYHRWNIFDV